MALFAPQSTPSVLSNDSVNILKNIIEGCSLSQRQSGQICCPSASEACGCVIGRLSKCDHPPEGIWLTFSLPQTLVWDLDGIAAGLTENLTVVTTTAEVLGISCRAALKPTSVCVVVVVFFHGGIAINLSVNNIKMCIR